MREVDINLVKYLHNVTKTFMESLPWYKGMTDKQLCSLRESNRMNFACHNGYVGTLLNLMTDTPDFPLQVRAYSQNRDSIIRDLNSIPDSVPKGVILLNMVTTEYDKIKSHIIGRTNLELKGTLFYGKGVTGVLENCCVGHVKLLDFDHPYYWNIPSEDQIQFTLGLAKDEAYNALKSFYEESKND